jgi:hypothetical protein
VLDQERDPLAAEFAALRTAVVCRPPGPAAARRTLRRRRRRAAIGATSLVVGVVAVLGLAVAGFAAPLRHLSAARPPVESLPSPDGSAPHAAVAPTAGQPGPSWSATAGPAAAAGPDAPCTRYGAVRLDAPKQTSVSVRVDQDGPYPLCPGERVRVFTATYSVDSSGVQRLYKSFSATLDAAHNPLTLPLQVPPCHVTIYVISGNQQVKSVIPAMGDFYRQAPEVYYSTAAGPYGGVVWLQEQDPCAGTGHPAVPAPA